MVELLRFDYLEDMEIIYVDFPKKNIKELSFTLLISFMLF
jgi:hypothetical protein